MKNILFSFGIASFLFCSGQNTTTKVKPISTKPKPTTTTTTTTVIKESTINPNAKPFSFTGSFTMNYTVVDTSKKTTSGHIKYAFDGFLASVSPSFSNYIEIKSLRSIFDIKVSEMTMLTEYSKGKKSALLLKTPKTIINQKNNNEKPPVLKKTGEKKIIEGYNCEKIILTYENGRKIESWITPELLLNLEESISMCNIGFRGKSPFTKSSFSDINGAPLETTVTEKDGSSIKITFTEIKKTKPDVTIFSTDGYDIKDARGIPMFTGQ